MPRFLTYSELAAALAQEEAKVATQADVLIDNDKTIAAFKAEKKTSDALLRKQDDMAALQDTVIANLNALIHAQADRCPLQRSP